MSGTDPYAAISDQNLLDLWFTGFTGGYATALAGLGMDEDAAQRQATHVAWVANNDPATRETILHRTRRAPQHIKRSDQPVEWPAPLRPAPGADQ